MSKNFFNKPFDEPTLVKLELYRNYLQEWLPVFLERKNPVTQTVNLFDLFAGTGCDSIGVEGSPLILINLLKNYYSQIKNKGLNVNVFFNDYNKKYLQLLKHNIEKTGVDTNLIKIHYYNQDFKELFPSLIVKMKNAANLLFLDQFGITYVTKQTFQKVINLPMTDLIFFISSSFFNRFANRPEFKNVLDISKKELFDKPFAQVHKLILDKYRELIPNSKSYYLAPFSIKRNTNIHGLIFGSGNLLGIEKFLKVCWQQDIVTGEANFDIYKENIKPGQMSMFDQAPSKSSKVHLFEEALEIEILSGRLSTDKDIYIYAMENGFLGQHITPTIKKLRDKRIQYNGRLAFTYAGVIKNKTRLPKKINLK